jgi:hypothetical protein
MLIGIGVSTSLTACVVEPLWGGGHGGDHERHWR